MTIILETNVTLTGWVHRFDRKVIEFGGRNPTKPPRLIPKSSVAMIVANQVVRLHPRTAATA